MWTRKELKTKGKAAMHRNYWKTVLVTILLTLVLGGGAAASSAAPSIGVNYKGSESEVSENETSAIPGFTEDLETLFEDSDIPDLPEEFQQYTEAEPHFPAVLIAVLLIFAVIVAVVAVVVQNFLYNPLEGGSARFYLTNLNAKAEVKELAYCYDHGYLNVVKTIFFKDLYTILWSLLLIIPGIIKAYEYRMMPYILAEHPDMPTKQVFAESRAMMKGNKWKAFVLDLSFLGWDLLSILTLGILGIFYVNPYEKMTNAALYEALACGGTAPAPANGGYTELPAADGYGYTPAPVNGENDIPAYNVGEMDYNK